MPKRTTKSIKDPKSYIFKNLKKPLVFFRFLGPRIFPKEPQEAQKGSQEAPKELQNLQKKGSKNRPQKSQVLERFWVHFGIHFGAQKWTKNEPKNDPKNDPKNAPQKCLKKRPGTGKIASHPPAWARFLPGRTHPFAHVR